MSLTKVSASMLGDVGSGLAAAVAAVGSTPTQWIISNNLTVSDNLTIPANISITVFRGAIITVAAGKTLTINGTLEAGLYQIFGATGSVILGKGCVEKANPEWWGAVADGTTDCQPAITLYAAALMASGSGVITFTFSSGNYYLATPVILYLNTTFQGIRMEGTAAISNYVNKGTVITGAAGMLSMFIFRAVVITTSFFYSFECRNISFLSGSFGTTGPKSALLSLGGGQSARPFIVQNCTFKGFTAAIKSDMTGSGLSTGICNVVIRNNFFLFNTYSLHGVGNDSIVNLDFSDNQAGTGGGINATVGGPYLISGNTMESNSTALGNAPSIVVSGGLHNGRITNNYFEAINTGDLINVSATAPYSTVYINDNYISSCSGSSISLANVTATAPQDLLWGGVKTIVGSLVGKSVLNTQSAVYVPTGASTISTSLDINSVSLNSSLPPLTIVAGGWVSMGGTAQNTPITGGTVDVATINGSGTLKLSSIAVLVDEWVVFSALARRRVGNGALYVEMLNNAQTASIGVSNTNAVAIGTGIGEWYYIMVAIKASADSGGSLYFNWNTEPGTQIDVTETYTYLAGGLTASTPIYTFLPSQ
jgi:hypothetical protein